ncbi:MAG: hypothetical protein IKU86_00025 [Thermoguttaceae bacterium]|nr:hypothetical protein [Thermoguttaceae bacterium]
MKSNGFSPFSSKFAVKVSRLGKEKRQNKRIDKLRKENGGKIRKTPLRRAQIFGIFFASVGQGNAALASRRRKRRFCRY